MGVENMNKTQASNPAAGRGPRRGPGGGPHGMMPGEKAKNFKGTMKTLWGYIRPFKFKLLMVVTLAVLSTVFSIVSPAILGTATNTVVAGLKAASMDYAALLKIVVLLLGLYGLSFLFNFGQSFIMAGVSQKITYNLREQMSLKMDRLPLRYFDTKTHGEILSRVTNDIETVNQSLAQSMTQIITSGTTIIGVLAMMFWISPFMAVCTLVILPLSLIIIKIVVGKSQGYFKDQQKYLGMVNGHVEEMYTGHTVVKAFNREDVSVEEFEGFNAKLCNAAWKSQFLSGLMQPLTSFVGNLAYVFICVAGGWLAINGKMQIGDIQAFIQYVRSFNQPVAQMANVANVLQSTAAAAERVFEFLDEEEETAESAQPKPLDLERLKGQVTFEHVRFGYNADDILIKDFSFTAEPGQRIAIVGPTGAGKTTIVKLLMRFYELSGGRILIDGTDIREYTRSDLRDMFGMVLQDTWLFSGSVMDNIRYGKPSSSEDEVRKAAKAAHIDHFIRTQPGGYNMEINEEASNISQGQKQLLTIARAFLADNPILILDEATSSVDTRTEKQIQQAMEELMKGRTSFIIAHRLSTIRDADNIIVMNGGDIVEQGTHEQLLAAGGFYAKLYNSQF